VVARRQFSPASNLNQGFLASLLEQGVELVYRAFVSLLVSEIELHGFSTGPTTVDPTEIEHTAMLASGPGPDIEYIAGCSITISLFDNSAFEGFIFINPDRSTI